MCLTTTICLFIAAQAASEEEREHAELLMEYQNVRGGRVRLASILQPETEFNHDDKVTGEEGAGVGSNSNSSSRALAHDSRQLPA